MVTAKLKKLAIRQKKPSPRAWPDLMTKAQDGDSKAYQRLLTEITPLLRNYFKSRLFNSQNIEDAVQDALLGIHKARHTYDPKQPFENWMYGIARYKLIDTIRKQTKLQEREISDDEVVTFFIEAPNKDHEGMRRDLTKALATLPSQQQMIVTKTKIDGYSYAEVAEDLGMTETAVKVAAHRAFKRLRKWLLRYGYE